MPPEPFAYAVLDEQQLVGPATGWPRADHPGWVSYATPLERKRALCDWRALPPDVGRLLARLLLLPAGLLLGLGTEALVPDAMLWGGGCHEMRAGDHLDLHLDADRHPWLDLERRANAILFLDDWQPGWGGELELWAPGGTAPAVRIEPARGRLVLFATGDGTPHRVAPLTCPADVVRRSLAVFWYGWPRGEVCRPRARFLPLPGELPDPARDQLRRQRATWERERSA